MLKELIIASHNQGKINEFRQMLTPFGVRVYSALELGLPDVEETGTTFKENASIKAETLSKLSGKPCLADDSGLCVTALGGRPGVYSARYAPNRNFDIAMEKLISELKSAHLISELKSAHTDDWSAHFACVLALKEPEQETRFYEGRVDGSITEDRRGDKGFGFDPIFIPQGYKQTFAEMSAEEKSQISHRGRALATFLQKEFNVKDI